MITGENGDKLYFTFFLQQLDYAAIQFRIIIDRVIFAFFAEKTPIKPFFACAKRRVYRHK